MKAISATNKRYSTIPRYSLKLVKEKGIRYPADKVYDSKTAELVCRAYLETCDCEHLIMLMIDGQNNMVGLHTIAIGGVAGLSTSARDIMKHAIAGNAFAIILAHNHPSGNVRPSEQDIIFTNVVKSAGLMMGIPLVDHIIISSGIVEGSFSFMNNGIL